MLGLNALFCLFDFFANGSASLSVADAVSIYFVWSLSLGTLGGLVFPSFFGGQRGGFSTAVSNI